MSEPSASGVIDFSAHLDPGRASNNTLASVVEETEGPVYHEFDLARQRFEEGGLDGVVLSQPSFFGHHDVGKTRDTNDHLLDLIEPYPNYYALAGLPSAAGGAEAAEELDRCLANGYNGGVIKTWVHEGPDASQTLEPIFEVAEEYGAPLLLHPEVSNSLGEGVFDDTHRSNAIFGRNAALSNSLYLLIHQGYFDHYPNVQIIVHHMGGDIAGLFGQIRAVIERAFRDADLKAGRSVDLKPFEEFERQFLDHIYLDTVGYLGDFSSHQTPIDAFPASNIVFGSDWPCEARTAEDFRRHIQSIRDTVTPDDAERILGGNALDLLVNVKHATVSK